MSARARGFTLLEVMVAVAILGLSLTVILSAQAGLYASGGYAQHLSLATGLARCRMSELEERLLKLGYPELEEHDEGVCCGDESRGDMKCTWDIVKIELPAASTNDPLASLTGGGGFGDGGPLGGGSATSGAPSQAAGGLGPLGALVGAASNPASIGSITDGGLSNLSGALAAGAAGGTSALAPLVMGFVYPQLKPMLEASIRKVTVKVVWREGVRSRELVLTQYLTNPTRGGLLPGAGTAAPGVSGAPVGGAFGGPRGVVGPATPGVGGVRP